MPAPLRPRSAHIRRSRFGEVVRSTLAEIFLRESLEAPSLIGLSVVITDIKMSPDLRHAMLYVRVRGNTDQTNPFIVKELNTLAPLLRKHLGMRMYARYVPSLRFEIDQSFDHGERVDRLLRGLRRNDPSSEYNRVSDVDDDDDGDDGDDVGEIGGVDSDNDTPINALLDNHVAEGGEEPASDRRQQRKPRQHASSTHPQAIRVQSKKLSPSRRSRNTKPSA